MIPPYHLILTPSGLVAASQNILARSSQPIQECGQPCRRTPPEDCRYTPNAAV